MNQENEFVPNENTKNNSNIDNTENELTQDVAGEEASIESKINVDSDIIEDFIPEPIKIPKYNVEKEQAKHEKVKEKNLKRMSKKSKKRRRALKKALIITRTVLLVLLLTTVLSATLSSLLVRMNTSEYSISSAIRTHNPETFVIGKIKNVKDLNLNKSASKATLTDILRDNAINSVTYSYIVSKIDESSYSDFIAKNAHGIISFYLYGTHYDGISGDDIANVISDNASHIKLVTGKELGQSACNDFKAYVNKSSALKDISPEALKENKAAQYTDELSIIFSIITLAALAVILMILLIIIISSCQGYAHTLIGWCSIVAGIIVGVAGFFFNPGFSTSNLFIRSVYTALIKSFHTSALIYGGIVILVGIIVMLIGRAMKDEYEYEEDYDDYDLEDLDEDEDEYDEDEYEYEYEYDEEFDEDSITE